MGIFDKDKKPKLPKDKDVEAVLKKLQALLEGGAEPSEEAKLEIEELPGGARAITGQLPKGFDIKNQAQVRELVAKTLKDAGVIPEDMDVSGIQVDAINLALPEGISQVMDKSHATQDLLKDLDGKGDVGVPDIPLPQDMLKGAFVTAYNALHHKSHELAPLAANFMRALEPLRDLASKAGGKELEAFRVFEKHIVNLITTMSVYADNICSFGGEIAKRGIPVSDVSDNTVN